MIEMWNPFLLWKMELDIGVEKYDQLVYEITKDITRENRSLWRKAE